MNSRKNTSDPMELRADLVTRDTLDVNDGIERVMGNRELYGRMLRRFRNDYKHGAMPIRTALSDNDSILAHRLAHTLKGAAGMVGAHRLLARATDLEEAIRTGTADLPQALASLAPEMENVLSLLEILLDGSPPAGVPVHVPSRPLLGDAALLARLVELLSNGDGAAVDLLEESGASLKVILGDAKLTQVADAIRQFDFEGAVNALGETACGQNI